MNWRRLVLAVVLLAVVSTTGCGFRRSNSYRRSCDAGPALLPVTPVPVVVGSNPCCCP